MGRASLTVVAVALLLVRPAGAGGVQPPRFAASSSPVTTAELPYSYRPGCPVAPSSLRLVHLTYWGFDGRAHRGALVVNGAVVASVERAFGTLYAKRFPIRRMEPIDAFKGSDDRSMAADNTSAFNCRYAVTTGPKSWSAHAYGQAVDVDPLENPYLLGSKVFPPAGRRYVDRAKIRPGMAFPGGTLDEAFAAVGWQWGGRWTGSPDYQHFSSTGG
jgi:hypothetical protein